MRALKLASVAVLMATLALVGVLYAIGYTRPVPYCKIIDGREIVDHHCIPYCPPDPTECD